MSFVSDDRALVAQLDRAFGYGPKGWEFEPSLVHKNEADEASFFLSLEVCIREAGAMVPSRDIPPLRVHLQI